MPLQALGALATFERTLIAERATPTAPVAAGVRALGQPARGA